MIGAPSQVPGELAAEDDLVVSLPPGRQVALRRYRASLHGCPEKPAIGLDRAYSVKPLVLVDKQALFPELAVLALFRRMGWDGAWVDLSHRKFFDRMPNQSKGVSLGAHASQVISRVAQYNDNARAGCWDLVLWAARTVAFAAVLRSGAGELGEGRTRWLAAALKSGMSAGQFVVVEWEPRSVVVRRKRNRDASGVERR